MNEKKDERMTGGAADSAVEAKAASAADVAVPAADKAAHVADTAGETDSPADEAKAASAVDKAKADSAAAAKDIPDFDYHDAMIQIEMLFQSHILSFGYKEYSLETYVDRRFFRAWKAREGCADTDEMRAGLNIDGILRSADPSEGEVLTYLQYTLNIAELCRRSFNREEAPGYDFDIRNYTELLSRIRALLRHFHYEIKYVPAKEFIFLVPHDPAAEALTEDTGDPVTAAITEYRSTAARGQLNRKRELLAELGSRIESFPDNLKAENAVLFSRIEFMLNNLHIRNDNREGEEKIERVAAMTGEEMEAWYDETYQMLLLRILQRENAGRLQKIDELAVQCGTGISSISEEEMARLLSTDPGELTEEQEAELTNQLYSNRAEDQMAPAAPQEKEGAKGIIIAIIIADILFMVFLICYFYFFM